MKTVDTLQITGAVKKLCIESNTRLGADVTDRLKQCLEQETAETGREVLRQILANAEAAGSGNMPMCQDTGVAVVFLELGQDVHIGGGSLEAAVQEGIRQGYEKGCLRKSMVSDPFDRRNTGDNTPAVIHLNLVPGEQIKLTVAPKGGGSENMSTVRMLTPSAGIEGVRKFVIDWIVQAGANPCPPVIAGIGIGGNFERCALLAKRSLLRDVGQRNPDPFYSRLEQDLLEAINKTGIGPMGYGGRCTALDVFIEAEPCHIASLPVAVNLQCHAARHRSVIL